MTPNNIFSLLVLVAFTDSLKILVYSPAFAGSHTNFMARIADTLTESGHNVTFFVPIFDDNRSNQLGVKLTKNVIKMERSEEMKLDPVTMDNVTSSFWNINVNSKEGHSLFDPVHKLTVQSCRSLFSNSELLATLRSHEYDVGISEPMMTCSLALFRHLGIQKTILASSCPNFDVVMAAMGEPAETSYVPVSGDIEISSWRKTKKCDFCATQIEQFCVYSGNVCTMIILDHIIRE
ncbi:Protein CBG17833 [Caenorhabditis briggsae]|uniref:glucuronosyltransferase n=1 Tax=Caenorhabditis briggsae TaxID=6238 RepID=A8XRV7_CAEBR|nr:Protein CBG17833 [Caenorhabditis briggsae]CAP35383.2 Protein CBG17833 [Caenorhabditis briggsae]